MWTVYTLLTFVYIAMNEYYRSTGCRFSCTLQLCEVCRAQVGGILAVDRLVHYDSFMLLAMYKWAVHRM